MSVGIAILLLGGICQGSFGLGYKKYSPLKWEAFWFVYSFFCIAVSVLYTLILIPDFFSYTTSKSVSEAIIPMICGALWGISAIGFSKGVTFIGMSLVYGISMGISAVIGSVIPLFSLNELPLFKSLVCLAVGIIITLFGIILITKAGIIKDKANKSDDRSCMKIGLVLSALSGLGSGAMNIGFDKGKYIADKLMSNGYSDAAISAAKWFPVLVAGCLAGMIYCAFELFKYKTWNTFFEKGALKTQAKLIFTSIIWFAALVLYGIASQLLGDMGAVGGWIAFNALALIIGNIWGLKTGEWKDSPNAMKMMLLGSGILILAWVFIAQV